MKRNIALASVLAVAMTAALATGASAHTKKHHTKHHTYVVSNYTVTVSCFRGPWKGVIWDRPNAVFIDSLVAVGYDFPTAHAIGERICRDSALVGNPDSLRSEAIRVLRDSPAHRTGYRRTH